MPLRGLVLLLFFLGSLPICFIRPFYGIVLWIVLAFLNPQSYTWTMFDAFPWAQAVAAPTIAGMLLFDRRFDRFKSPQVLLIIVLWLWFTATTLISVNSSIFVHHAEDTWVRWNFVSKVVLMTLCTIPIVSTFQRLRYFVLTIGACFGFYVLKSFPFILMTGGVFRLYGPDHSMIADNNDFGLALNMTMPLYFYLAQTEPNKWVRRFMAFLCLITIPAVFFTYSRGAMVGLVMVGVLIMIRSKRRFMLLPVVAIGVVFALFFAPEAWKSRMDLTSPEVVDLSARQRLNAWAFSRNLAADYPIFGGGFATFTPELFERYAPTAVEDTYGAHSVYFQALAEHGYVGLGLYLTLVASCFLTLWRLRRAALARGDTQVAAYAQMFQFSLVGFLTSGLFLGRAYFDYYFTIVSCIAVLGPVTAERWAAEAAPTTAAPDVRTPLEVSWGQEPGVVVRNSRF